MLVVSLGCPKIPPKISSAIYACHRYDDRVFGTQHRDRM